MEISPYRDFAGNIWQSPSEKKKSARGAHARAAQTIALTHYGLNKYAKGLDIQP